MDRSAFRMHLRLAGKTLVVEVGGQLGQEAANAFESQMRAALWSGSTAVLLDLSEAESIDAAGVRALVAVSKLSETLGDKLQLRRRVSESVEQTLEVSGALKRLPWEPRDSARDTRSKKL